MIIEPVTITDKDGNQTKGYFIDNETNAKEHRRHEILELCAIAVGIATGILAAAATIKKEL